MYSLFSKSIGTPYCMRDYGNKVIVWESKETAVDYLKEFGESLDDYLLVKIDKKGMERITKSLGRQMMEIELVDVLGKPLKIT